MNEFSFIVPPSKTPTRVRITIELERGDELVALIPDALVPPNLVMWANKPYPLPQQQWKLLHILLNAPHKRMSHEDLISNLWDGNKRTIDDLRKIIPKMREILEVLGVEIDTSDGYVAIMGLKPAPQVLVQGGGFVDREGTHLPATKRNERRKKA